ncbi:hypothetical protein [Klenkia soli]|uniref:hypothetical protein n=1 Tax=Klenkia soli TaxID=1052260 RepID=UPI000B867118|nr:hypothetical protein [Klenkia soli]
MIALPVSLAVLSGCWLPDVSMSTDPRAAESTASTTTPGTAAAHGSASAAATEEAAAPTAVRASGELDAGSVTHQQSAGDRTLVIDYWTTQQADEWTPASTKTIQLSAHLEGQEQTAASIAVNVTRFTAVLDDGSTRATVVDDQGQFALQPPFTYGTVLDLPATDPDAGTVTVTVQFDLLVETGRGTDAFYRQTVIDTLQLPLVLQETTQ